MIVLVAYVIGEVFGDVFPQRDTCRDSFCAFPLPFLFVVFGGPIVWRTSLGNAASPGEGIVVNYGKG